MRIRRSTRWGAFYLTAALIGPMQAVGQSPDSVLIASDTTVGPPDTVLVIPAGLEASWRSSVLPETAIPPEAQLHLAHLAESFPDTPGGESLLKIAMLEGEIAAAWVRVAGVDTLDVTRMIEAMTHVIHAIDPAEVRSGNGMGYGFRRAAEDVQTQAEMLQIAVPDTLSPAIAFHAPFVSYAAYIAQARADDVITLARQVQSAQDVTSALPLIKRLAEAVRAMMYGEDVDNDGRIGRNETEVGLAQAAYHLSLVYRMAGAEMPSIRPWELVESLGLDTLGRQPDSVRFRRRRGGP